jgi:hypothetical protein
VLGFFPRFQHAAVSAFAARREDDGSTSISVAVTVSPFAGPMIAANTSVPDRNGSALGLRLGAFKMLGQLGQNEALEFICGGPHAILRRLQRRVFNRSSDDDPSQRFNTEGPDRPRRFRAKLLSSSA